MMSDDQRHDELYGADAPEHFGTRIVRDTESARAVGRGANIVATVLTGGVVLAMGGAAGLLTAEGGLAAGGVSGAVHAVTGTMMVGSSGAAGVAAVLAAPVEMGNKSKSGLTLEVMGAASVGASPVTLGGAAVGAAADGKNGIYIGALIGGGTEALAHLAGPTLARFGHRAATSVKAGAVRASRAMAAARSAPSASKWTDFLDDGKRIVAATKDDFHPVVRDAVMVDGKAAPRGGAGRNNGLWTAIPPGVRIRRFGDWWVKTVNPESNRFMRWYGGLTLKAQHRALQKLGDLAPEHAFRNGRMFTRNVGDAMTSVRDPGFFRAWWHGSRRIGFLNDIRPRNVGKNGLIFDPAFDPLTKATYVIGAGSAVALPIIFRRELHGFIQGVLQGGDE